jgi:hypothetical protein
VHPSLRAAPSTLPRRGAQPPPQGAAAHHHAQTWRCRSIRSPQQPQDAGRRSNHKTLAAGSPSPPPSSYPTNQPTNVSKPPLSTPSPQTNQIHPNPTESILQRNDPRLGNKFVVSFLNLLQSGFGSWEAAAAAALRTSFRAWPGLASSPLTLHPHLQRIKSNPIRQSCKSIALEWETKQLDFIFFT